MTHTLNPRYGQSIFGLGVDGKPLRAGVFNEHEVRAAAGVTMVLAAYAFVSAFVVRAYGPMQVISAGLFIEFLVRVWFGFQHSPVRQVARWLMRRKPPEWASATPKRFAWTLGLAMASAMVLVTQAGVRGAVPMTICLICLVLMWLEAVLGLCIGCELHGLLVRRGWTRKDPAYEICAHGACEWPARPGTSEAPETSETLVDAPLVVGQHRQVPVLDGTFRRAVNLDNAASTPVLLEVMATVRRFMDWYSSVHRGAGHKSQVASLAYEDARQVVLDFVGADPHAHVAIFVKNTTEAINKLAARLDLGFDDIVLVSQLEHHSNDLPWRARAQVLRIRADEHGGLDESHLQALLDAHAGRVRLVAITGGSNVTGHLPDIHRIAARAHAAGARILVDGAQLAPHRAIDMRPLSDPAHLDYLAISGHKMYAPFGTGVLIGRRDTFERGAPDQCGGGTVLFVSPDEVAWAAAPDRDEAGTPNVVGAVALAAALQTLSRHGMDRLARHEAALTAHALTRMAALPNVRVYGQADPASAAGRLGVIAFNVDQVPHGLVAAILSTEFAIAVRHGCFCAHPYLLELLRLDAAAARKVRTELLQGDHRQVPGMVRISFGLYNTLADVDAFADALAVIARGGQTGRYVQDPATGEYRACDHQPDLRASFRLDQVDA
ncbi:aminotransferase class V-fold PLP-dependent enzyme [Leptothrix sp. BB-4]